MTLVRVSREESVATLLLDRPDARNALSVQMCEDIVVALHEIGSDPDARSCVIRGAGSVFCSGADFAAVSGASGVDFVPAFERMLESVARCSLPTVACIHGAALGGGLQLATVCDFRIVADDAKVGIPSAKLGILVNFENVQRLVLLAGIAVAKEVLMTARTYSGKEAAAVGLATRSVPADELEDVSYDYAEHVASLAPQSVRGTKRSIQVVVDHLASVRGSHPDSVAAIDRLVVEAYQSEDLQEGIKAMSEKRSPRFTGR